jgi:hypothetical protein
MAIHHLRMIKKRETARQASGVRSIGRNPSDHI